LSDARRQDVGRQEAESGYGGAEREDTQVIPPQELPQPPQQPGQPGQPPQEEPERSQPPWQDPQPHQPEEPKLPEE
jgi:hypothetical protein